MSGYALPTVTAEICFTAGAREFEASDTFTRADTATEIGAAESGQEWLIHSGTWGITANRAAAGTVPALATVQGLAGGDVSVTFVVAADEMGLAFRVADVDNYWRLEMNTGATRFDLYCVDGGVETLVGSTGVVSVASGVEARVRLGANIGRTPSLLTYGTANSDASTPDHASLDITSDLDLRWYGTTDWTPSSIDTAIGKWDDPNKSYGFRFETGGEVTLFWSPDGTTTLTATSTNVTGLTGAGGIKITLDVNNGAAGRTVTFWKKSDPDPDVDDWQQVGSAVVQAGVTSIFAGTAALSVGDLTPGAGSGIAGETLWAEVRDGIGGTVVADPDWRDAPIGATSITDSTGKVWTTGAAAQVGPVTIDVYIDGDLELSVADLTHADENQAGMYEGLAGSGRFDDFVASFVWEDVTDYLAGFAYERGRQHDLARTEAGHAAMLLRATDRRFEPEFTAGAYYPFVVPMRRVRLTATWGAVTYGAFYGFVERWPFTVGRVSGEELTGVEVVDSLAVAAFGLFEPNSVAAVDFADIVDETVPHAYYRLGDATYSDFGPNGYADGTVVPGTGSVTVTADGLVPTAAGDDGAAVFVPDGHVTLPSASWLSGSTGDFSMSLLFRLNDALGGEALIGRGLTGITGGATEVIRFVVGAVAVVGTTVLEEGVTYHAVGVRRAGVLEAWLDGTLEVATWTTPQSLTAGTLVVGEDVDGTIDEVAWWDRALTPAEISQLAVASTRGVGASTQLTGARVHRIADMLGFDTAQRDIDTGASTMNYVEDLTLHTPRAHLDMVEGTEEGLVYIEGDGTLRFRDRNDPYAQTAADVFGDGAGEVRYEQPTFSYDIDRLVNDARLTIEDGETATATDAVSVRRYQQHSLARTTDDASETMNADHAAWLAGAYADPHVRIEHIAVDGREIGFDKVLPREPGDRVTVKIRPDGVTPLVQESIIQHISAVYDADKQTWRAAWKLDALVPTAVVDDDSFGLVDSAVVGF